VECRNLEGIQLHLEPKMVLTCVSAVKFKSGNHAFSISSLSQKREEGEKTATLTTVKSLSPIRDADFVFENSPVRIIINRNCPEIQLVGLKVGPFEEGKEYEVQYWIANQLEHAGIARLREEELLDIRKIDKTLWKEKVQQTRQVAHIEEDFYPRLRHLLHNLKKAANSNPEKMNEYRKAVGVAHDIVNVRLRKIIYLASSPEQTNQILNDLAREERFLYERLFTIINEWKTKILKVTEEP